MKDTHDVAVGDSTTTSNPTSSTPRRRAWVRWATGLGIAAFAGWSLTWAAYECGPELNYPMGWDEDQIKAHNQHRLNTCLRPWEHFTDSSEGPGTGVAVAVNPEA